MLFLSSSISWWKTWKRTSGLFCLPCGITQIHQFVCLCLCLFVQNTFMHRRPSMVLTAQIKVSTNKQASTQTIVKYSVRSSWSTQDNSDVWTPGGWNGMRRAETAGKQSGKKSASDTPIHLSALLRPGAFRAERVWAMVAFLLSPGLLFNPGCLLSWSG